MAETKTKNIYEKLNEISKLVDAVQKTKKGYNYSYADIEEILAKITVGLDQQRLFLYPKIDRQSLKIIEQDYEKIKKTSKETSIREPIHENVVLADMTFVWVNLDNIEEQLEVPWTIAGQQNDASQAFGSGLTYCTRYFYLKFFHIATTDDDPDNWRSKQQQVEADQRTEVCEEIKNDIDAFVKKYVGKDAAKQQIMIDFLKKHNGNSANYMNIKDVDVAKELKNALEKEFGSKKEE